MKINRQTETPTIWCFIYKIILTVIIWCCFNNWNKTNTAAGKAAQQLLPYTTVTQMSTINLPTFVFSILPVILIPEYLTYCTLHLKRKNTQDKTFPLRDPKS